MGAQESKENMSENTNVVFDLVSRHFDDFVRIHCNPSGHVSVMELTSAFAGYLKNQTYVNSIQWSTYYITSCEFQAKICSNNWTRSPGWGDKASKFDTSFIIGLSVATFPR